MGGFGEILLPRSLSYSLVLSHPLIQFLLFLSCSIHMPGCPHRLLTSLDQSLELIIEKKTTHQHGSQGPSWSSSKMHRTRLSISRTPQHSILAPLICSKFSKHAMLALLPGFAQAIASIHNAPPNAPSILHTSTTLPPSSDKLLPQWGLTRGFSCSQGALQCSGFACVLWGLPH